MPYLIGTDEAGYGPWLGPLVISSTLWWVDEPIDPAGLYKKLNKVVCPAEARDKTSRRLAIGDSKALYATSTGLGALERGVLAALGLVGRCPADWLDVWQMLAADSCEHLPTMPWHVDYDLRLPLAADPEDLARLVPRLTRGFEQAGVRLVAIKSRAVFPDEFNRSNEALGNKAETLSRMTIALLADTLALCEGESVIAVCDKHGGRAYYNPLLQQQFPDPLVEVHRETPQESAYRWGPDDARIEVRFHVGGERFMPTALASMTSKYLRELSMRAFNDFWCGRVRDLAPTAGYSRDARRFRDAIEPVRSQLGIAEGILWRQR